jgi:mRNA-degrading endonuclease YafQ of YafQ-DinJ toxin-antitoxin module
MEVVQFRQCSLLSSSVIKYKELGPKLKDFVNFKLTNPIAPFGSSDKKFASNGSYNTTVPNLRHAHLSPDVSIVYKVHDKNPMLIDMYGLFSHEELGTGNPSKANTQKTMAKRFSQQSFNE